MFFAAPITAYAGLFGAALLAATIVPAQSELLLVGLLMSGQFATLWLLAAATAGNVLGSLINWALGRFLAEYRKARWFPASQRSLERAERWFARYGSGVLLLSWLPIVGDPLTLIAGVLRMRLIPFLLVVTLAKGARYSVIAITVARLTD